jgi:hypothetical protein
LIRGEEIMVTFNQDKCIPPRGSIPVPPVNQLVERVRAYLSQHPEVSREELLLEAVRRVIVVREQKEMSSGVVGVESEGTSKRYTGRPPLTAEDIRMHAVLAERLALLHYERYGLWPKVRRFLFGNHVLRLPELRPQRTGKG